MRSLNVGEVIGRGLGIFFRNFFSFMLICTIVLSPIIIHMVGYIVRPLTLHGISDMVDSSAPWSLLEIVLGFVAAGGVTYGVIMELRGKRASILSCLSVGFTRMLPVLGVVLLTVLSVAGPMVPGIILAAGIPILGVFALLAGVVFAIVVYMRLWVAVPVAVVERPGVMASLKRSSELTAGSRWAVFGVVVIVVLVQVGSHYLMKTLIDIEHGGSLAEIIRRFKIFVGVQLALSVLFTSLSAVFCAVAYHDLRTSKDGTTVDELAAVFD